MPKTLKSIMPEYYSINEACNNLHISEKCLTNYVKIGQELSMVKVGNRKVILTTELERWKIQRDFGYVILEKSHYIQCLEFAINSFYSYRSTSDFGTSTQRDAGKFIQNFVIGKLGEIAVKAFLKKNFDIDIQLDFAIREAVVGQDITELARPRRGGRVFNPLKRRVAIKSTKMKNVWLIVPENEATDEERASDIYIFSRVDLYLDHLIRLIRDHDSLRNIVKIIPPFENIPAEVCGFVEHENLIANPPVTILPIQNQKIGSSYIKKTGELEKNPGSWKAMLATL